MSPSRDAAPARCSRILARSRESWAACCPVIGGPRQDRGHPAGHPTRSPPCPRARNVRLAQGGELPRRSAIETVFHAPNLAARRPGEADPLPAASGVPPQGSATALFSVCSCFTQFNVGTFEHVGLGRRGRRSRSCAPRSPTHLMLLMPTQPGAIAHRKSVVGGGSPLKA